MNRNRRTCSSARRIARCAISWALALLASMLIVAGASAGTPSITEYPIAGSANPDLIAPGLATDPAASVWVSDPYGGADGNGRVYRVEAATGAVSGTFAPPAGASVPGFLVRGPDARMWVTAADANGTLMRAAADGAFTDVTPTGGARGGLTVGPDGNVWYLNTSGGAHNGQVGFVDPSTLASQQFDIPTADSHPQEITAGPAGDPNSVWFTEEFTDRIGRVDTITHEVTDYGGLSAGARPNGIVAGSDGALWFAEYGTGKIGRIDPVTHHVTEYDLPGALGGPDRMTVAPGGRIWFTLFNDSEVGSFIPGPNPTFDLISTPTAGAGPSGITIGPDGHVWFAEYNNHAVARIDGSYSQLPNTTIDSGPSGTTTDTTARFTFHSDDPAATFECSLDNTPFGPCSSPYTTPALADGQHSFTVRAVNAAGPDPSPPSRTFTVTTPPAPPAQPPVSTTAPSIVPALSCPTALSGGGGSGGGSGCTVIPHTYRCDPGVWEGADPLTPNTSEWQELIPDKSYFSGYRVVTVAAGETYFAQRSDSSVIAAQESWSYRCAVTATGPGGTATATSSVTTLDPAAPFSLSDPTTDIHVSGIEVTQAVQLSNACTAGAPCAGTLPARDQSDPSAPGQAAYAGVAMAAGKFTVVRVFANFTAPSYLPRLWRATATLEVRDENGNLLSVLPPDSAPASLGKPRCGLCVGLDERADPTASFNFLIPWQETTHPRLSFRATVSPRIGPGEPLQCGSCHGNTFLLTDVPFHPTVALPIHPIPLTVGGVRTGQSEEQVFGATQTILPEQVQIFPYDMPLAVDGDSSAQAAAAVLKRAANDGLKGTDYPIGVFIDGTKACATCAPLGGLTPVGSKLGDQNGPYSIVRDSRPITSAMHEIGHGLGLLHAGQQCPVPYDPNNPGNGNQTGPGHQGDTGVTWPPDDKGRIHGVGLDRRGWDIFQAGSLPQTFVEGYNHVGGFSGAVGEYYDFMSYCDNVAAWTNAQFESDHWISTVNWSQLLNYKLPPPITGFGGLLTARDTRTAAGATLRVIAIVDPDGNASIYDITPDGPRPAGSAATGPYRIELRDRSGNALASVTPTVTPLHIDGVSARRPPLLLSATLPFDPTAGTVAITAAGRELARRTRSPSPPTARLISPRPGSTVGRSPTTLVRWTAADRDRDRLAATIEYSADRGRRWKVLADRLTGTTARIPSRLLAASRNGLLRVRISDGFDLTTITATRLHSIGAPPVVQILGASRGGSIRAGSTLLLQAAAFDDAGTPLTGRRLRWYDGQRPLGTGDYLTLRDLVPGITTIRLLATDTTGRPAEASTRLHVHADAPAYLAFHAPTRVSPRARRVRIVVATTTPATFTVAGKHYQVNHKPLAITIAIRPGRSMLRLRCSLRSPGGTIDGTYIAER